MKLYALFTLHKTGWGTRAGIGDPATATTAAQQEKTALQSSPPVGQVGAADPGLYDTQRNSGYGYSAQDTTPRDAYPMYDTTGYDGPHGEAHHGTYDVEMSQHRRP